MRTFKYTWTNLTTGKSGYSEISEEKLRREAYAKGLPHHLPLSDLFDFLLNRWNIQQPKHWQYVRLMD